MAFGLDEAKLPWMTIDDDVIDDCSYLLLCGSNCSLNMADS